MPFSNWIAQCECSKGVDKEGYHLLTYKHGGGPAWVHNILSCWNECLNELQIFYHKEPRNRYAQSENCPDIVFFVWSLWKLLNWIFLWRIHEVLDTVKRSGQVDGYASLKREKKKLKNMNRKFC